MNSTAERVRGLIRNHPLHPLFVHFPVAFLSAAVVTDLLAWVASGPAWLHSSLYFHAAGCATGAVAIVFGILDARRIARGSSSAGTALMHGFLMAGAWLIFLLSLLGRYYQQQQAPNWMLSLGSALAFLVFMSGGWLGASLVYQHGVGVSGPDDREP